MSLNASGKFNLAVFGVILLAFTTEYQFQSVFGNNPIKKLSHNNFSVCLGTQPARSPADTSWSREVKLDREIEESSSPASGYNLVSHTVSFSREGRLHCEVVCMFPTNKVLTQVCSSFLTQVRVFLRTVVLDMASVSCERC